MSVISVTSVCVDSFQAQVFTKAIEYYLTLLEIRDDIFISTQDNADSNCHIWHEHDTREACYLNDMQYCQQLKAFHPRRTKLRCSGT